MILECAGRAGAATALSGARGGWQIRKRFVRAKSGVALRLPPQSKTIRMPQGQRGAQARRTKLGEDGNQIGAHSAPVTADRKFEEVVKSAQDAAVLVLVY